MVWIGFRNPNRFWLGTHPRNLHIAWCCCKRLAKYLPCEVFIIFGLFDEFHSFAENRRRKGWERYTKGPVCWSWMAKHSPKHAQNKIQVQLVWVSKAVPLPRDVLQHFLAHCIGKFSSHPAARGYGWNIHIGWPSKKQPQLPPGFLLVL